MKKNILVVLLSCFAIHAAYAQEAGKIIFSSGINKIIDSQGKSRIAKRGQVVNSGDKLQTTTGRMQVRFTDKGFVALKPRSELVIEEYKFNGKQDGSENAIFNLLKGSVRAITGLVGKKNKKAFRYKTPVATIGIRGTAFVLNYCNNNCFDESGELLPNGLYVNNGEGKVIVQTNGGIIDLARGQFAFVKDRNSRPEQILELPAISELIREQAEQYDFEYSASDIFAVLNSSSTSTSNVDVPVVSTGTATGIKGVVSASAGIIGSFNINTYAFSANSQDTSLSSESLDPGGALVGFTENRDIRNTDAVGERRFFNAESANAVITPAVAPNLSSQGADATLMVSWGTWLGDYQLQNEQTAESYTIASYPLHYVYSDNITPDATIAQLISSNVVAVYDNFIGGNVTYQDSVNLGTVDQGTLTGTMTVNFATTIIDDFSLTASFNSGSVDDIDLTNQGLGFNLRSFDVRTNDGVRCNVCQNTSNAAINGQVYYEFVGQNAEGVIGSFNLSDGNSDSITGAFVIGQ